MQDRQKPLYLKIIFFWTVHFTLGTPNVLSKVENSYPIVTRNFEYHYRLQKAKSLEPYLLRYLFRYVAIANLNPFVSALLSSNNKFQGNLFS